ncbi:hypothetical protein LK459_20770 [Gordonia otitidis]|uniref:hypothetical protein n=1 Tax=Gordonia otitidis TaxID=249058 RepID=UPI001D1468D8|nr:hypothetical protein [Gordonia otitidis]UEA61778.1 hypothetical protein LK459_20770 [Gordonia otitidis]
MGYVIVDAKSVAAGHGPHPAASPFDRRISETLGITAFEVYQVELPAHAETVTHDHTDDRNDDVYAIISGSGWVVVDDTPYPITPGQFISVDLEHRRHLRAGPMDSHSSPSAPNREPKRDPSNLLTSSREPEERHQRAFDFNQLFRCQTADTRLNIRPPYRG